MAQVIDPLMTAITDGNIEVVKSLLNPENINKEGITKSGRLTPDTPLFHSIIEYLNNPKDERSSIIELLIGNGAKLSISENKQIYRLYKMNFYVNTKLQPNLLYYFETLNNEQDLVDIDAFLQHNADTLSHGSVTDNIMAAGGGGDEGGGTSGSDARERKIPKPNIKGGKRLKKKKERSKRSKRIKKKSKRIKRKSRKSKKSRKTFNI
jgi:hypothetical protein